MRPSSGYTIAFGIIFVACSTVPTTAAEIKVMISGGLTAAYRELVPKFEEAAGHRVTTAYGPSMGTTVNAIPARLARGEAADVLIMVGYALADLAKQGKVVPSSQVDLVRSPIGIAVRAGAPKPDIGTVDSLRAALLAARSVAYSDSASGVYVERELFKRLGIEEQMKSKSRMIPAEPVGEVVARGQAEIGFQQISELLPVRRIEVVGPIPADVQQITVFSAGIATQAAEPAAANELITFLASPASAPVFTRTGLDPIVKR